MPDEKAKKFAESGFNVLYKLSQRHLESFLKATQVPAFKEILAKHLDKGSVFRNVIKQVIQTKTYNKLFVSIYNYIFKDDRSGQDIAEQVNLALKEDDFLANKEKVAESLKELLLKDESDEFVSSLYKKTLMHLTENPVALTEDKSIVEKYLEDLKEESVLRHYFYIIMEMIKIESKEESINRNLATPKEKRLSKRFFSKIKKEARKELNEKYKERIRKLKEIKKNSRRAINEREDLLGQLEG